MEDTSILQLAPSSSARERNHIFWGSAFLLFGFVSLLGSFFAAIISKLLPPFENRFLSAVQSDRYYCLLVPLTLPVLVVAVYFHWLSMKVFKHA